MSRRIKLFVLSLVTACVAMATSGRPVYILPIEDEIDARAWQHTRRAIDEARKADAQMFVVKLNTYGGALDAADSIRSAIIQLDIPTVAFVDHNAASAGALIALSCDTVMMTPGSSMGAATVVGGDGQPMPDKYQSYMSSMMRATAERHGKIYSEADSAWQWRRNPEIAEGMVRGEHIVSFSTDEALAEGYSDATVNSLDEALTKLGVADAPREHFEPTLTDDIIGFLSNGAVRAILVMLILGGLYMEMHTPGLGFAAAVSVVATCLYILPMLISGTLASWIVVLLIIGLILIALEIFVIPGFGFCGITGIAAMIIALTAAIVPASDSADEGSTPLSEFVTPFIIVGAGILAALALVIWLTSSKGPVFIRRRSELMLSQKVSEGYIGVDMTPAMFVGHKAETVTDLRPAGKIRIDEKVYDAVSTGSFIDAGTRVRVVKYENAQLYVEPTQL